MSMPLNDMPIDELIRTARNYANCLQPITTYTEIMHELLNRLDAMRVYAKVLANKVDWAKGCIPAGNSQVMPDFEGVTMTQRECYQAGLEAGKTRRVPDGWISAINKLLDNDGSRGCFDLIESNAAHREIEQLLTDLKGHNEPFND